MEEAVADLQLKSSTSKIDSTKAARAAISGATDFKQFQPETDRMVRLLFKEKSIPLKSAMGELGGLTINPR